ncbi:MAG: SRPBCC family protein [Thermoplasmatota archaeon]
MPTIKMSHTVACPPAKAFAAIVDLERFPDWNPSVKQAKALTPGPARQGSRFEFTVRGFGMMPQELQEYEKDRCVRIAPQGKAFGGGHLFTLTPEGTGTRIDHELVMQPRGAMRLVAPLMKPMMRKNLRTTMDALKRHLEDGRRASP